MIVFFFTNLMHKFFILVYLLNSSTCFEYYHAHLQEDSRNLCTEQSPKESDDNRCCTNTICPPEDEHDSAGNM